MEPYWNPFEAILKPFWNSFGTYSEPFWIVFGTVSEPSWNHFRTSGNHPDTLPILFPKFVCNVSETFPNHSVTI